MRIKGIFIKIDSLPDVETVGDFQPGLVDPADQAHAFSHIRGIVGAAVAGPFIIFRNLITVITVKIKDMFRNIQRPDGLIDVGLLLPVDQKLCSRSGDPAYIPPVCHGEEKGLVGHA